MIHVLHICSDYSRQRLYSELFLELSKNCIRQTIFVPVRSEIEVKKYDISGRPNLNVVYAHILTKKHRILYHSKIKSILAFLKTQIDLHDIDIVHAHFLFSDGGVAFHLKQQYEIPYIVTVRNTDVNFFFKYMLNLRGFGRKILNAAGQVLFVTPSYRKLLLEKYIRPKMGDRILAAPLFPNGLHSDWFENSVRRELPFQGPLKLLYVGDFTSNKNIVHLLKVVQKLNDRINSKLTLVGGGGDGHKDVLDLLIKKGYEFANYIGRVEGFQAMKEIYIEHHIFIMISKMETFGIVYLEAMSQGLPVIHSAGQGIDGYFEGSSFAIPVRFDSVNEIIDAVIKLLNSYEKASNEAISASKSFAWSVITKKYLKLYNDKLNK